MIKRKIGKKRIKNIIIGILLSSLVLGVRIEGYAENIGVTKQSYKETQTEIPKELKGIHAKTALLMDADTGRVLYEQEGYIPKAMASTTKIMTCIIALEYGNLLDVVTVSPNASIQPKVKLGLSKNEQFQLQDLLYSLMLESHNDSAVAIAEHIGGSVEGFAKLMNEKAKELGCENTNFVTPNGLDAPGHQTTAFELGLISRYAIQKEEFLKITNTPSYTFSNIAATQTYHVNNKNQFLHQMDGAFGIKTGFTGEAGYCFVGALRKDDKTFISVVLGSGWPPDKVWKWEDTRKLMSYGLERYGKQQIFDQGKILDPVKIKQGKEEQVELNYPEEDLKILLRSDEKVTVSYVLPQQLKAPVIKDMVVGSAKYYIDGKLYRELPIFPKQDIEKIDYTFCFTKIWKEFSL